MKANTITKLYIKLKLLLKTKTNCVNFQFDNTTILFSNHFIAIPIGNLEPAQSSPQPV